LEHFLA
jgi:hypothetical protein